MPAMSAAMVGGVVVIATALAWGWYQSRSSGDLTEFSDVIDDDDRELGDGQVRVTFLGTTTFLVEDRSTQLLFDAFLSPAPLRDLLTGLRTEAAFVDDVLDRVEADRVTDIFVAHSHHDHALDAGYLPKAKDGVRPRAMLWGTESTLNIGCGTGVPKDQLVHAKPGRTVERGAFTVKVIASEHSPRQLPGHDGTIDEPLSQPANFYRYKEGGSRDFLVEHGDLKMLFKASANCLPGALKDVEADALFIGTATLGKQTARARDAFADEVFATVGPSSVVVPAHWNDFTAPLSDDLPLNRRLFDDAPASLREAKCRTEAAGARFVILNGYDRIILGGAAPTVDGS